MAAPRNWFIRNGTRLQGPISSAELKHLANAGRITPDTEVSQSDNGPWRAASQIKGLFKEQPRKAEIEVDDEPEVPFEYTPPPSVHGPKEVYFDEAPKPVMASLPPAVSGQTDAEVEPPPRPRKRKPVNEPPGYPALRFYGHLFRILGAVAIGIGFLIVVLILSNAFADPGGRTDAAGEAAFLVAVWVGLSGFFAIACGEAILAYVDLVKDARRQRIASERTNALLAELLDAQAAVGEPAM